MNLEVFMVLLLCCSLFTGLITEAVKLMMEEFQKNCFANTLAGIVSLVVSLLVSIGYILMTGTEMNSQLVVCVVALFICSWLCAMLGYDKIVQTIKQITQKNE